MRQQIREGVKLRNTATRAKRFFHQAVRRHRELHRESCLDSIGNVWKAAGHLDPQLYRTN